MKNKWTLREVLVTCKVSKRWQVNKQTRCHKAQANNCFCSTPNSKRNYFMGIYCSCYTTTFNSFLCLASNFLKFYNDTEQLNANILQRTVSLCRSLLGMCIRADQGDMSGWVTMNVMIWKTLPLKEIYYSHYYCILLVWDNKLQTVMIVKAIYGR